MYDRAFFHKVHESDGNLSRPVSVTLEAYRDVLQYEVDLECRLLGCNDLRFSIRMLKARNYRLLVRLGCFVL